MRHRSDSGDNDTSSEETADPQNVTRDPISLVGEGGIGMNIEFFTDVANKNTEPCDKGDPDAKSKSRENEMEVFKCDPCSESNTRNDKNERVLATSFAMYLIFLLSKTSV